MKLTTKLKQFRPTLKILFNDYTDHSTIHGVSYMNERNRSWFEKSWWVVVFGLSVLGCGKMIFDAWYISPIIISFTEKPTLIEQIPFPAVALCPLTYARPLHFSETTKRQSPTEKINVLENFSEEEKLQMFVKSEFCSSLVVFQNYENYTNCNKCLQIMDDIKLPIEDLFVECKFGNQVINCRDSFKQLVVGNHVGKTFCYTFNGLDIFRNMSLRTEITDEWNIDDGYKSTAPLITYPRRALRAGANFGLSVIMRSEHEMYDDMCAITSATRLEYRMPYDTPTFETHSFNARMQFSTAFIIKPKMMITSASLRDYPVSVRKCYFSDEIRLKHFSRYTQENCEVECVSDYVLEHCGCSLMIYDGRAGIDICSIRKRDCIRNFKVLLHDQSLSQCKCLPACTSISFETEVYTTKLNTSTSFGGHEIDSNKYEYNQIKIYFKENSFVTSQRVERYGPTDFLATCGGLMGLFLGVSVISLLEIVYFCTIRLYTNLKVGGRLDHGPTEHVEGFQRKKVKKSRRCLKLLKELMADYFTKTTIQGVNYATEAQLSMAERIWWAVVIALSTFCCGSLISNVMRQYEESPVIISYASEETPISKIPYPAITLCPAVVFPMTQQMYDYFLLQKLSLYDLPDDYFHITTAAVQACDPDTYSHIDPENRTDCDDCADNLKRILFGIRGLFRSCTHLSVSVPCKEIFEEIVTEAGVCFTYNGLNIYRDQNTTSVEGAIFEQWTLEGGYKNSTENIKVYPQKASKHSVTFRTHVHKDIKDNLCLGQVQGVKVYLHLPNEAPQVSKHYYLAAYRRYTEILINPSMTITDPELRDLAVEKRQCYFSDERQLNFFRSYTQNNCEIECVVNLILKICNCLMFYMPAIPGVKFCGISDIRCYQSVIQQSNERNMNQGQSSHECNCLPTCTSISYSADFNYVYFTDEDLKRNYNPQYVANFHISHVEMSFGENQFVALKRSKLYRFTEFLAQCGGLLGLFLGFSFMSVMEIIYFCTVRLICDIKLKLWSQH